jgi:hypothetical protein
MNCFIKNKINKQTIENDPNRYNIPEQERLNYLDNLRSKIRRYYSSNLFEKAISTNKLAYDQGGELLENWLKNLEEKYGKNPINPFIK